MRTGLLLIDGKDAYTEFGVYVVKGGYNELVEMPPLKEPLTNDWHEEDGIEADLENPVLDSREFTVSFAVSGIFNRYEDFIALLSDNAYHQFNFVEIQRTYNLRLISNPRSADLRILGLISLKFADDFPLEGYVYAAPETTTIQSDKFQIDNKNVTEYGIHILRGLRAELYKVPNVKPNLETKSRFTSGRTYDNSNVTYKSKEVKFSCLLKADDLTQLWKNYDAFLHDLIQPEERAFYYSDMEYSFHFYYKNCKVTAFYPTGEPWLQFVITIVVTDNLRLDTLGGFFLSSEDCDIIITEAGIDGIDLDPNTNSLNS